MKTKILTTAMLSAFSLFLLSLSSFAQWEPQTSGTNLNLKNVCFTDNDNGWAVGDSGIILHTADGGNIWTPQTSGTDYNLENVHFIDTLNGWIAGGKQGYPQTGIILRTVNGGGTWEEMYIDTAYYLNNVCFSDPLNGWAVGNKHIFMGFWGTLLHSIDGGETWVKQDYSYIPLKDVHFTDPENGWIIGAGTAPSSGYVYSLIMYTNDGGTTWEEQINYSSRDGYLLNSAHFTDSLNGWAAGGGPWFNNGIILKTTDSGNNWDTSFSNNTGAFHSIYFTDSFNGWAVGTHSYYDPPTILRTANGGISWYLQSAGITSGLRSICFADLENGWVVGDSGIILHTNNGGDSDCPDYIDYTMQVQIDSFPTHYPNCTQLGGGC